MSSLRSPALQSTILSMASVLIPQVVPSPLLGGAGLFLIRIGRARAGAFVMMLGSGTS